MNSPEQKLLTEIDRIRGNLGRPIVVALDGGSGAGKSTIAESLMRLTDMALVRLDDFYQTVIPESELPHKTTEEQLNAVFDWSRVRIAVDSLGAAAIEFLNDSGAVVHRITPDGR